MKKLLYCAAALATLLFAGSCQKENLEPVENGQTISYTVQLPDVINTKALGDDITNVDDLYYEVWRTSAEETTVFTDADNRLYHRSVANAFDDSGKATIEFQLINNQNFTVLFWADVPGNGIYTVTDLTNVTVAQNGDSNQEKYAAFSGRDYIKSDEKLTGRTVELKRAVAQLNIATTPESLTQFDDDITLNQSTVTVNGLSTSFNVATQEAGDISTADYVYALQNVPTGNVTVGTDNYTYIAMNYVGFAKKTGSTIDVEYEFTTSEGTISNEIPNVPVKANYRTNIIGNLISSSSSYTVTLDDEWGDDNSTSGNIEVINDGIVKNQNGDYEITNEEGFAYAVNKLFENGGTFYILNNLNMGGYTLGTITLPNTKTLNLIGEKPVVTRASSIGSTTGITIKGLTQPLIAQVEEGATASFSNIVVDDYMGADTSAALVGENDGKVVVSGCEATDESDTKVDLVGNSNGTGEVVDASDAANGGGLAYLQYMLGTNVSTITLSSPVVIPADQTVELDLEGKTVSQIQAQTGAYSMIDNKGTLTLKNGTLTYADNADLTSDVNYVSNTILNSGILTIEDGVTVINNSGEAVASYGYPHPIDNSGTLVINGGTFTNNANYSSMRIWCTTDDNTNVTIHGGEFNGSIDLHNVNGSANKGTLTINAGTFNADTYTKSAVRLLGFGVDVDELHGYIKGGTFKGKIALRNYVGGEFNAKVFEISGGTFSDDPTEFLAEGYMACKDENGNWVVSAKPVAKIGETEYVSLISAVDAVNDGETITLIKDIEQADGVIITDKKLTIDLNDKTFTVSEGASTNNRNFKINGSSVVTIKNGTMVAAGDYSSGAYGTVRTEGTANVTLTDVKLYNYRGNGLNVKALSGTTVTISDTEVYSVYGGGIESAGGTIELTNVKVEQKGMYTAPYNSMAISVNGGGTVTVNSGTYSTECLTAEEANNQGTSHGPWCAGVLNSGGTLIINGGTFSNDNFGENSLATYARGLLLADTGANIQINGGTFNAVKSIIDIQNNLGDASKNPKVLLAGGNYSSNPLTWDGLISVVEGKGVDKGEDGRWTLVKVQQNNEIWYTSDEMKLEPTTPNAFNANIVSNVWDSTTGKGVITFDAPLTAIGNEAFKRITNNTPSNWMTSISLPNSVETIGDYAFAQCFSLTNITIPDSVTSIGQYAFQSCQAATTVTIGSSVTSIASGAFYGCWELNQIICKATTPPTIADKWVFYDIASNPTVIVPAGSVDAYKAANFWSSLNIVGE